jgi:hypothetical protein
LVNTVDLDGRSALWAAARAGDADSVNLCVQHGGDLKLMDQRRDAFSAGAGVGPLYKFNPVDPRSISNHSVSFRAHAVRLKAPGFFNSCLEPGM